MPIPSEKTSLKPYWGVTKPYITRIFKYNVKLNLLNIINTLKDMGEYVFPIKKFYSRKICSRYSNHTLWIHQNKDRY